MIRAYIALVKGLEAADPSPVSRCWQTFVNQLMANPVHDSRK